MSISVGLNVGYKKVGKIFVKQPGILTTIQDLGRWGFGKFGMPVAGVMDEYAARIGSLCWLIDRQQADMPK